MADILRGAPVARAISEDAATRVAALGTCGVTPHLVTVRVGAQAGDISYERAIAKRAEAAGVRVTHEVLPADATEAEVVRCVEAASADDAVHGILVFRPLPAHIREDAVAAALDPAKDVDGMTPGALFGVFAGRVVGFPPCTAAAVMALIDHAGIALAGKRVAVVGRSLVIGRPVAMLAMACDATVTICHSRTEDLDGTLRTADIIISATGHPGCVGGSSVRAGQVVVDVGVTWDARQGKMVGDVAFDEVEPVVRAVTPVPGGVGSVTSAVLIEHVVCAAERAQERS